MNYKHSRKTSLAAWVTIAAVSIPLQTGARLQATKDDLSKGVVYGQVLDLANKPVPDATVAVQSKDGKVIAWTKTNGQGEYSLPVDPMDALRLKPSKRRGLLEKCARAAGDVAMLPVKIAAGVVINPGKTIGSAAESVAAGNPTPLTKQVVGSALPDASAKDAAATARAAAARAAFESSSVTSVTSTGDKGHAAIIVSRPGYKEARITAGAYWLELPDPVNGKKAAMQAWLDTIQIAPSANPKNADVVQQVLTLSSPLVEPTLIPAGSLLKIQVKLNVPAGPDRKVRIFAREAQCNTVIELYPEDGPDKSIFIGTMPIDGKIQPGPTTIAIGAFRANPVEVKFDPKKADPLTEFVRHLDDMKPGKPYEYDPRIMGSENRIDVKITVLKPKGH